MTFTTIFLSRVHQGDPPKTYKRPKCPWCRRPLPVTIVKRSTKKGSGFPAAEVAVGYKYKGPGHFCSNGHAVKWANAELDERQEIMKSLNLVNP